MEEGNRWAGRGIAFKVEKWHFLGRYATGFCICIHHPAAAARARCLYPANLPRSFGLGVTCHVASVRPPAPDGRTEGRGRPRRYLRRG